MNKVVYSDKLAENEYKYTMSKLVNKTVGYPVLKLI